MPLEDVGLRAVIQNVGQFVTDANKVNKAAEEVGKGTQEVAKQSAAAGKALDKLGQDAEQSSKKLRTMVGTMESVGKAGKTMSLAVTLPLVAIGAAALKSSADFERSGNVMQAISGATGEEMDKMKKKALQLGKDTSFSAGDAMKGMLELSKAGLTTGQTFDAITGTILLAAAANTDVGYAAEIASNAMNMFGLSGKDVNKVADIMAASANSSSIEIKDMGDALKMVGAVAGPAGLKIDEVSAALAIMGNRGMKGSDAGTSLKQMLLSLQAPSAKASTLMRQMGFDVYDTSGNMVDMRTILSNLEKSTSDMTQEQRDYTLATIFGSDAVRAANIMLSAGTKGYDAMYASVTKSGAAQIAANANMKGLSGAIEYFKGTLDSLMISTGTPWLDMLSKMVRGSADLISKFSELPAPVQQGAVVFGIATAAAGPLMVAVSKTFQAYGKLAEGAKTVASTVATTMDKLRGESDKMKDVASSADDAAKGKEKVTEKNIDLAKAAETSTKKLSDEIGMLDRLRDAYGKFAAAHELKLPGGGTAKIGEAEGGALEGVGKVAGSAITGAIGGWIATGGAAAILSGIGTALAGVGAGIAGVVSSPALAIGVAIAGALAYGLAIGWLAKFNWDQLMETFPKALEEMKGWGKAAGDALGQAGDFLKTLPEALEKFFTETLPFTIGRGIGLLVGLVIFGAPMMVDAIGKMLTPAWDWVTKQVPIWTGQFGDWLGGLATKAREKMGEAKDWITGKLGEAWNWVSTEVPTWPGRAASFLSTLASDMGRKFGEAKAWAIGKLSELWAWASTEVPTWPGKAAVFLAELAPKIGQAFTDAKNWATGKLGEAWTWISENLPTWPDLALNFLITLPDNILAIFTSAKDYALGKLGDLWTWISTEVPTWAGKIVGFIWDLPTKIEGVFRDAGDKATEILKAFLSEAGKMAGDIAEAILIPLRGMVAEIEKVFSNIVKGIEKGLQDAKDVLGIKSPSTVMASIGRDMVLGLVHGLDSMSYKISDWMANLPSLMLGAFAHRSFEGALGHSISDLMRRAISSVRWSDFVKPEDVATWARNMGNVPEWAAQEFVKEFARLPATLPEWEQFLSRRGWSGGFPTTPPAGAGVQLTPAQQTAGIFRNYAKVGQDIGGALSSVVGAFQSAMDRTIGVFDSSRIQGAMRAAKELPDLFKFLNLDTGGFSAGWRMPKLREMLESVSQTMQDMASRYDVVNNVKALVGGFDELGMAIPPELAETIKALGAELGGPFADAIAKLIDMAPQRKAMKELQDFIGEFNLGQQLASMYATMTEMGLTIPAKLLDILRAIPREAGSYLDQIINQILSGIPGLAGGTDAFRGGLALIGEKGAELAMLPRGTSVYPAGETRGILSGMSNIIAAMRTVSIAPSPAFAMASVMGGRSMSQSYHDEYNMTVNSNASSDQTIRNFALLRSMSRSRR